MSEKILEQIKIIDSRRLMVRLGLVAVIVAALFCGWIAVRWQLGNMLAELTEPTEPNAKELAALAVNFAPADPLTNWLLAAAAKDVFAPKSIASTVKNFEVVAQLSPNDYRWWVELARVREQADEPEAAERAYLRALELAPGYAIPRWQLGNFYLRQNRSDEAFAELKQSAATNPVYRDQVFSIAWDFYQQDTVRLEQIAGDSPQVRAGLARFYASKQRAADSLRMWNTLSPEDKAANSAIAKVIAQAFYAD